MPDGKPAGTACVNLNPESFECRIWNHEDYPTFCRGLQASEEMCGGTREYALEYLAKLEILTRPVTEDGQ